MSATGKNVRFWIHLTALAAILVISPVITSASAAELQTIREAEHATIYIEVDTINPRPGKPAVWTLWNHASEQVNLHHEPYRSVRLLNEYDCDARTVRLVEIVEYAEPLGNGEPLRSYPNTESDPRPVIPGSVADTVWSEVCTQTTPAKSKSKSF